MSSSNMSETSMMSKCWVFLSYLHKNRSEYIHDGNNDCYKMVLIYTPVIVCYYKTLPTEMLKTHSAYYKPSQ